MKIRRMVPEMKRRMVPEMKIRRMVTKTRRMIMGRMVTTRRMIMGTKLW